MELREVKSYLETGADVRKSLDASVVLETGKMIADAIRDGGKLILFGNGGSAADSQHIAAELVGRFEKEGRPLPAMALTTNTSSLTAIGNDYSYEEVFSRQVRAFARRGDVVVGISTSGNSRNVIAGIQAAKEMGCRTIGLTGSGGGKLLSLVDACIRVPSDRTSIIQEVHIAIGHIWSKIVEDELR